MESFARRSHRPVARASRIVVAAALFVAGASSGQTTASPTAGSASATPDNAILLTCS